MSINFYRYTQLSKGNITRFKLPKLNTYVPSPNDTDYKRGYIVRYFIQKSNDTTAPVYEISKDFISEFINSPFYSTKKIDWKISGTDDEIKEANGNSLRMAAQTFPAIINYLPYLLQFKK
jgi:hypothetical protein